MTKKVLKSYAKLVAAVGANVQKDQEVIIHANVDQVEFVSLVVEECYKRVKNVLDSIEGKQEKENLTNAVTFYILDDIGDKSDKIHRVR